MRISYEWLKEFIELEEQPQDISEALTSVGLEVEAMEQIESVKGGLEGLVIGHVKECYQHPNADRLRITKVDVGAAELLQIVCGAPNVAVGQKVIVATVGTTVHPTNGEPFKINKSKIRSELSEGMICAEDEIGLGESHDGIKILPDDAEIGMPFKQYYGLKSDVVFEIGLTPNRADAASHLGVARDLAAIYRKPLKPNDYKKLPVHESGKIKIQIENLEDCKRFTGIYLKNVKVATSPKWLIDRLNIIGVKPINNIVDITNYICHGLGQPMHAYDADKITDQTIIVRRAKADEKLLTLDHIERELKNSELVIADTKNVLGVAGAIGGLASAITEDTKNVFLECAYFNAASVRKSAKSQNIKTDASFRFERGTDPDMCLMAASFAVELMQELAGAEPESGITDVYPEKLEPSVIHLTTEYAQRLIGKAIPQDTIKEILTSLGIKLISEDDHSLTLKVPLAKVDVTRPCDLVEEVLRIYGLNNIEMPKQLRSSLSFQPKPDEDRVKEIISEYLSSNGFNEMMSNSLTSAKSNEITGVDDSVEILNPLSIELQVLRSQMISSGLESIAYNINRKNANLNLYEWGNTYHKTEEGNKEFWHLSLFMTGNTHKEHWNAKPVEKSFFHLKSIVDQLIMRLGLTGLKSAVLSEQNLDGFAYLNGKIEIIKVSSLQKSVLKSFDISQAVYFADFNMTEIFELIKKRKKSYKEPSKFPEVRRDLSMLVDQAVSFESLKKVAMQAEQRLLKNVDVFDVYQGEKLPSGKKSYALSFVLLDEEKTLQDQAIDGVMNKLIAAFEKEVAAEIRKAF